MAGRGRRRNSKRVSNKVVYKRQRKQRGTKEKMVLEM